MKGLHVLLLGVVALLGRAETPSAERPTRPVSLAECLQLALQHNLQLQIARQQPELARFTLSGDYGVYDPVLRVNAGHTYDNEPLDLDPKKAGLDSPYRQAGEYFGSGLRGMLPTGLSYDLTGSGQSLMTDTLVYNNNGTPAYPRHTNQADVAAALTLRQPLLKDFWIDQPRYEIQVNKKNLKIAELALLQQMMNIVTKTEVAYYDLTLAREEIGVQEMALAQARQLLAEDQRRVQMGMLPPAGEQDAAAQVATAQANLLAAQFAFASQQNVLKGLIGDDFRRWADVRLDPSDTLEAVETPLQRRECWDLALAQRPDIRQFRLELEKNNLQVRYRFNQLFPSLDVVGSVGGRAVDSTFGAAFDQLGDFSNPRYSYGVVLSYPLSNRAARNAYRASETERTTAELRLKQLEQDILIQVDDAVNFVETAFRRVSATRQARTYAEAALAAERRKLQNGESTSFIVLEMLNRLTASRGVESRALTDYHKALAQLAFAEGSSLERNRLEVKFK